MLKHITFSATILMATATSPQASALSCLTKPICSTIVSVGLERLYMAMEPEILDSFKLMYRTFDLRQNPKALLAHVDMIEKRLKKEGKLTPKLATNIKQLRNLLQQGNTSKGK